MIVLERRRSTRHPFFAAAEIREPKTSYSVIARTNELSRTGCYLDMLSPISAGIAVDLRIVHGGETVDLPAVVVHSEPNVGMGLHFDAAESARMDVVDRWLSGGGQG